LSRRVFLFVARWRCCGCTCTASPNAPDTTQPIEAAGGFLQSQGAQPKFEAASKLSNDARNAMKEGRVFSVPHFSGSFAWQGNAYPYTMVGSKPQLGGTTEIPAQIVPISMFFEEFADEGGSPVVLDPAPVLPRVQSSPNFHNAQYATGPTQFADAVQRAEFNRSAGRNGTRCWASRSS
jgi:hypothetical protein